MIVMNTPTGPVTFRTLAALHGRDRIDADALCELCSRPWVSRLKNLNLITGSDRFVIGGGKGFALTSKGRRHLARLASRN